MGPPFRQAPGAPGGCTYAPGGPTLASPSATSGRSVCLSRAARAARIGPSTSRPRSFRPRSAVRTSSPDHRPVPRADRFHRRVVPAVEPCAEPAGPRRGLHLHDHLLAVRTHSHSGHGDPRARPVCRVPGPRPEQGRQPASSSSGRSPRRRSSCSSARSSSPGDVDRHGLDRRFALWVLSLPGLGRSTYGVIVGFGLIAFCHGFVGISNTATTAMLLPIGLGMMGTLGRFVSEQSGAR